MTIKAFIIDDDADSRLILADYFQKVQTGINIEGEAANMKDGIAMIHQSVPELLLLDIELPDGTGFDLLDSVRERSFEVIFITAFNEYAVKAFRLAAVDYILKPVSYEELSEAIQKVKQRMLEKNFQSRMQAFFYNASQKELYEKKLAIATTEGFIFVPIKEIIRLESHSNYTAFHFLQGKKLVSSRTLGYYEELLPEEYFCRIHHSHIVNTRFADKYVKGGVGGNLVMQDGLELPVSQRKKEALFRQLIQTSR